MTKAVDAQTIEVQTISNSRLFEEIEVPNAINIIDDGIEIPKGRHVFRVLSHEGDKRLTWDSGSLDEINDAKKVFLRLVAKGLKPFRVGVGGKASSEAMTEFDATAEEVIFLPQALIVGG